MEPLIDAKNERLRFFPVQYPDIYDALVTHKSLNWFVDEIDFSRDRTDFTYLPDKDQRVVKYCLAFFSASDFLVSKLIQKHKMECTYPEVLAYFSSKDAREWEHTETYSKLITSLIEDDEHERLLNAIQTMPIIAKKSAYMMKYYNASIASRLIADAINEGIFFSGLFCVIFFLRRRHGKGKLQGLFTSNEFINRDETNHRDFACLLYRNHIVNKLPIQDVKTRLREACEVDFLFLREAVQEDWLGLTYENLCDYIRFQANVLLRLLGYSGSVYEDVTSNPCDFMVNMSIKEKSDSFATRVTSYANVPTLIANDPLRAHENEVGLNDF